MSIGDKLRSALGLAPSDPTPLKDLIDQMSQQVSSGQIPPLYPGTTTQQQILQGLGGLRLPPGLNVQSTFYRLSPEEEKELDQLEKEREARNKIQKIEIFKSLPKEFRQNILNILLWEKTVYDMNNTREGMSIREAELYMKKGQHVHSGPYPTPYPNVPAFGNNWAHMDTTLRTGLQLPQGITREDLLASHMDASLEEEIRGE